MLTLETVSLVASLVSVILGFVAIALSVVFYIMSNKMSQGIKDAENKIEASVKQIQKISDLTTNKYLDIITKDHEFFRQGALSGNVESAENNKEANEKIKSAVQEEIRKAIVPLTEKQDSHENALNTLNELIEQAADQIIDKTREVEKEVREEEVKKEVLDCISLFGEIDAKVVMDAVARKFKVERLLVVEQIFNLRKENKIFWHGTDKEFEYDTTLFLAQEG